MKLTHIAVAAAAAVTGPSLVMAAPAIAQDRPAATVPDTAPNDATAAPAPKPTAKDSARPAAPQPKAAPGRAGERRASKPDDVMQGPRVTAGQIPREGFRAGGDWTLLAVRVDNSAHRTVSDFTPRISFHRDDKSLRGSQIRIEVRHTDAAGHAVWTPAPVAPGPDDSPYGHYAFGLGTRQVKQDAVYTVQIRVRFTPDTTPGAFDIATDGVSMSGGGYTWAPTLYEVSRVTTATDDGGGHRDPNVQEGPRAALGGVPAGFTAGGDWHYLTLSVDNTGRKAVRDLSAGLSIATVDDSLLTDRQILVEEYRTDAHGTGQWVRQGRPDGDREFYFGYQLSRGPLAAGHKTTLKVRIKFTADAPTVPLALRAATYAYLGNGKRMEYNSPRYRSAVLAPNTTGGTTPTTGGTTSTTGGSKPTTQTTITTPVTSDTGTQARGELAHTGTDSATTWALAAATVLVGTGAAFIAGTGRHRRPTA
ncbi:hypothetical protein AB0G73_22135 [Streptomyces sp. NPDC020719]|uniref:hypothetical protein n=1 Tax=Streptomyces sp. NPDC020719 TaxID=3154896 RepID=UPI0033DEAEB3